MRAVSVLGLRACVRVRVCVGVYRAHIAFIARASDVCVAASAERAGDCVCVRGVYVGRCAVAATAGRFMICARRVRASAVVGSGWKREGDARTSMLRYR